MSKYGNIKHKVDNVVFDSTLERDTYLTIKLVIPQDSIIIHYPIEITPATSRFPKWSWKVDFYLPTLNIYIESKGVRTAEWLNKLRALDALKPAILDRLLIVATVPNEEVCKGIKTVTLDVMHAILCHLKHIQYGK